MDVTVSAVRKRKPGISLFQWHPLPPTLYLYFPSSSCISTTSSWYCWIDIIVLPQFSHIGIYLYICAYVHYTVIYIYITYLDAISTCGSTWSFHNTDPGANSINAHVIFNGEVMHTHTLFLSCTCVYANYHIFRCIHTLELMC